MERVAASNHFSSFPGRSTSSPGQNDVNETFSVLSVVTAIP